MTKVVIHQTVPTLLRLRRIQPGMHTCMETIHMAAQQPQRLADKHILYLSPVHLTRLYVLKKNQIMFFRIMQNLFIKASLKNTASRNQPNKMNTNQFIQLIPKAASWAAEQEKYILANGTPLLPTQLENAKKIRVKYPEKIRLLKVSQIPLPEDPELKYAAQALQLITINTIGLTLHYGIFIKNDYWYNREIIIHELVQTAQYERLGGIQNFLNQYLTECINFGYPAAPLEQEAIKTSKLLTA